MFAIVGLGNPGDEYAHTRHNAGFETVDLLADKLGVTYWKTTCGALVGVGKITLQGESQEVLLAKPQSFMNLSGGPVSHLCKEYKLGIEDLIVIHDELDIPATSVRVKKGGGHAGHNGLRSIIDKIGSRDFYRIRVGIGRPPGKMKVPDYVLSVPKKQAKEDFDASCYRACEATLSLLEVGLAKTQAKFNA
jgi:peptidyl-tRNA hydrolase, PTH1 family